MRGATWAKDFPRLYELYRDSDRDSEANFFASFEKVLEHSTKPSRFKQLEGELEQLEKTAWHAFKQKAVRYVTSSDKLRGREQLGACFNEVKGYLYLRSEGCEDIHFIPEEPNLKSPDFQARCGNSIVLLEVKTINHSDAAIAEIDYLPANSEIGDGGVSHTQAKDIHRGLDESLKHKITSTIAEARKQLLDYDCEGVQRRIAYLVIRLDWRLALDSRGFDELAAFIVGQSDEQVEVKHCCED